jgi:hypothetical protein
MRNSPPSYVHAFSMRRESEDAKGAERIRETWGVLLGG